MTAKGYLEAQQIEPGGVGLQAGVAGVVWLRTGIVSNDC